MISVIYAVITAFLSVALIAFGWMPCPVCCSSGVTVVCCANPIPETLTLTVTLVSGNSCTGFVGTTQPLTWDGSVWISDVITDGGAVYTFSIRCISGTIWGSAISSTGTCIVATSGGFTFVTCPSGGTPFAAQINGTVSGTDPLIFDITE